MIYEQFKSNNADILIWDITESADELIGMLSNFECYKTEYESIGDTKERERQAKEYINDDKLRNAYTNFIENYRQTETS